MATPLYAFKEDIDMLQSQLNDMKKGYGTLDYMALVITELRHEQQFQAAQMRRIEDRLNRVEKYLLLILNHLQIKPE